MTIEIKQLKEEDFKTSGFGGNGKSFKSDYVEEVKTALTENKGKIIGLSVDEGLKAFEGKSENPTKALNVKIRTLYKIVTKKSPNNKVSINNKIKEIQVDLR